MKRIATLAAGIALFVSASAARADNPTLVGNVGQGDAFIISLTGPDGKPVVNLDPGTYTLVVHDHSAIHDFDLFGPGNVNATTTVEGVGDSTFTITLVPGKYSYVCDAHPSMKGSFTVGASAPATTTTTPAPKPVPKHHAKPKKKKKKK
ncbi:MAG TPA: hypothetical protein VIE38_10810 [Gaiellaceae bacterium]|jgi:hypothetical protein